jgi:hypothetical protein
MPRRHRIASAHRASSCGVRARRDTKSDDKDFQILAVKISDARMSSNAFDEDVLHNTRVMMIDRVS